MKNEQAGARRWAALAITALVIAGDRISKAAIQHSMNAFDSVSVIAGWLRIVHTENPGAAFGVLAEGNPMLRSAVLIGVSSAVLVFVAWALWGRSGAGAGPLTRVALALILGGAVGNLYDRVLYGAVTDFIEVYHGAWSFPAFNVADSAITVGAALLMFDLLRGKRKPEPQAAFARK
ncbi:MAG: signal peptidase II [Acidobacteriaceae bacterium]|nr:signal peptidase II [Acidobacteriaceae bacterium]